MTDAVLLYSTAPNQETAERIGAAMVEAGLAACANIISGMRSVYRWKGAVETAAETVLIVKTVRARAEEARAFLCRLHPYETPCVLAIPIDAAGSNPDFLAWLASETRGGENKA